MSDSRRFFWGRSLPEALAKAVRHHQIPAEAIAYRVVDKRHGFVRHPRAVILDVDPAAPRRSADAPPRAPAEPAAPAARRQDSPAAAPVPAPPPPAAPPKRAPAAEPPREAPSGRRSEGRRHEPESFVAPDADAEMAALEATRKLVAFAGLDLEPRATVEDDRLRIDLDGADRERLASEGIELLDAIDLLLPRAVFTLSGRWVRCRVEGAGLREAREEALRARARAAAERVRGGEAEIAIEGLGPAERRILHLELAAAPDLVTESRGRSEPKALVVRPAAARPVD